MKKTLILLSAFCLLATIAPRGDDFYTTELRSEEATRPAPFSLPRVVAFEGGLRLFIATSDIKGVINLYESEVLESQLSQHSGEDGTASPVSLSLRKAIWCTEGGEPVYIDYRDPSFPCGETTVPARVEYLFGAPVSLGPEDDLAIGLEPDFLWIVERKK